MIVRCFVWLIMATMVGGVAAQDLPAIVPSAYRVQPGARLELSLIDASARAAAKPWDDDQVAWTLVRVSGTQENSHRAPRADENATPGTLRIGTNGATVVGVDFKPRAIALDVAALKKLVEGRKDAKAPEPGSQVRLIQSAKTIIRVGASEPGQSANVTAKTGQQVEIRPVMDPTGLGIGSDVPVVVYAGDGKVAGATLIATHIATGERLEFVTNASAIGHFRQSRAGAWRVEFRQLVEAKERRDGEPAWTLHTATLTFEARDGQGAAK
jgi:hypothetical protein